MKTKNELSRITVDIPKINHKKLKAMAALTGRSMREIITESIEDYLGSAKYPNKKTLKAMEEAAKGKVLQSIKIPRNFLKNLVFKKHVCVKASN